MDHLPNARTRPAQAARPSLRRAARHRVAVLASVVGLALGTGMSGAAAREPVPEAGKAAPTSVKPASAKPATQALSLDELRDKLADRVAEVREAQQARDAKSGQVPVLRVTVKTPGHGAAALPDPHAPAADPGPRSGRSLAAARPNPRAAPAAAAGAGHGAAGHAGPHWSYQGVDGPEGWGELAPEFATCARGQRQSPIDIREGIRVELEALRFDYQPVTFGVIDNGHTIQVNVAPGNAIEVGGRRYDLVQFHFHRPSEERINGRQYDMNVHLVHKDPQGRLAVVAVLIQQGRQHPLVQAIWNNLPLEKHEEQRAIGTLDLMQLLPEDRRYYTYMGSLTTPPCSEGVLWMVLKQPVSIAADQLAIFSRLYPMNARPVQPVSNRLIKESN